MGRGDGNRVTVIPNCTSRPLAGNSADFSTRFQESSPPFLRIVSVIIMTMNDYESNFYYFNRHNHDAQVVKKAPKNRSLGAKEPLKVHARVRKEPQKGGAGFSLLA